MKNFKLSRFYTLNVFLWFSILFNIVMIFYAILFDNTNYQITNFIMLIYHYCWLTGAYYFLYNLLVIVFIFIFILEIIIRKFKNIHLDNTFQMPNKLRYFLYYSSFVLIILSFFISYIFHIIYDAIFFD